MFDRPKSLPPTVFILRLPSGMRCVLDGRWEPTGVPAIAKLFDVWTSRHASIIFFTGKAPGDILQHRIGPVAHSRFSRVVFHALPFHAYTRIARIDQTLNGLFQWRYISRFVRRMRPSFLYCDRANLVIGAWYAWWGSSVVVRMLGVARLHMFWSQRRNAWLHPLRYFAIRAPFKAIICSEDGSPGHEALSRHALRTHGRYVWFNGIDFPAIPIQRVRGPIRRILFVGRLESGKGATEFIAALAGIRQNGGSARSTAWQADIVGDGSLRAILVEQVRRQGLASHVVFAGSVPHHEVGRMYARADVFVSLNELGNLSNVVLEALASGCCTIVLGGDGVRDRVTDTLLKDIALPVDPTDVVTSLAAILRRCIADDAFIQKYAAAARAFTESYLPTWSDRIAREVTMLERIALL